ncbi:MAG: HAMP domain-containing sensor histidine kinase [Actinomycetota bacterium]|nr:HAMP domain-containing sensor histidine kinase [Actinomycetota bacterium]
MRRRFALAMSSVLIVALFIAGIGVALTFRSQVQSQSVHELGVEAEALASHIDVTRGAVLKVIKTAASLSGAVVIPVNLNSVSLRGQLPAPLVPDIFNKALFLNGGGQAGIYQNVAYAAIFVDQHVNQFVTRPSILVITRSIPPLGKSISFLLIVIAAAIVVGLIVAAILSARFARYLRIFVGATQRISEGDFNARVESRLDQIAEFQDLERAINSMAIRLEEAQESQNQFLISISHDLKTPLTSISGYAEAIIDGAIDPASGAQRIEGASQRLSRLIQDLLDLAKLRANTFSLSIRRVTSTEIIEAALAHIGQRIAGSEVRLFSDIHNGSLDVPLEIDPDRLIQVLTNILNNAYKFARTSIAVSSSLVDSHIQIRVRDDGPGIPTSIRDKLFNEPIDSGDHRGREGGSGYGLLISERLSRSMGASLKVEETSPKGTSVLISIPIASASHYSL